MDISVAIGRNVGDEPMSDDSWFRYRVDVEHILRQNGYKITNREIGHSSYEHDGEWQTEPFARLWATNSLPGAPDIRPQLAKLAQWHKQWGIAYSVLKFTEMVGSDRSDTPDLRDIRTLWVNCDHCGELVPEDQVDIVGDRVICAHHEEKRP